MRARHDVGFSILVSLVLLACGDDPMPPQAGIVDPSQPSAEGGVESADGDDGDDDEPGTDPEPASGASSRDAGAGPRAARDASLANDAKVADAGTTPRTDGSTSSPSSDGGDDAGAKDASPADGAATSSGDIPAPAAEPMIWGFGLGVTDLPGAVKFYTEVMKMTVEKENVRRDDRTETILYATQAKRGARIVLMKFDDMRNTRKITAKLVFQAQNTRAVNSAAMMHPDYESRLNIGIVQFDGPETYIHEVGSIFDSGGGISVPYPLAMGFATSDLAASRRFYVAIGMSESRLGSFSVTDATGSGMIEEYTVKFGSGSGAVLQKWSPMRNAKDNPIKLVLMVPDAKAVADKVVAAGGKLVKDAERLPVYDNRQVIVAKDIDGYLLDIVQ